MRTLHMQPAAAQNIVIKFGYGGDRAFHNVYGWQCGGFPWCVGQTKISFFY